MIQQYEINRYCCYVFEDDAYLSTKVKGSEWLTSDSLNQQQSMNR